MPNVEVSNDATEIEGTEVIEEDLESPLPETRKEQPDALRLAQQLSQETFVPDVSRYKDHFSLPVPSSTIRFRDCNGAARVILGSNSQLVLEETHDGEFSQITLKKMRDSSGGLRILRTIYTVETAFFLGFMLVLSLQVILFVFLDAAIYLGRTDMQTAQHGIAIGLICSLPVFIRALASALTIAGHLVVDTWNGNVLVKSFVFRSLGIATIEWMLFLFHLGFPFLIMCICLLIGTDSWWENTALTWFICIFIFYFLFTINVIHYEVNACWETMKHQYKNDADNRVETYIQAAKQSILLRQNHTYSGVIETTYLSVSDFADSEDIDRGTNKSRENAITEPEESKGIIARLTLTHWECFGMYRKLDKPVALYSIKDAQDQRPFLTSTSWSLEKAFCRPKNSRYVAILKGPGRIRSSQIKSTLICSLVGLFLMLLLLVAALVYIEVNGAFIAFMVAAFLLGSWSRVRVPIALFKLAKEIHLFKENANASRIRVVEDNPRLRSEGVYFVKERHRVTEPSKTMIWILFVFEISLFWLYPTGVLYAIGNAPMAVFFMFSGFIYLGRYYCNAACVLEEFGSLDCIGGTSEYDRWKKKSRLNDIIGNVTKASGVRWWSVILGVLALITAGIAFTAVGESTEAETLRPLTYIPDFYYDAPDTLRYPTCTLRDLGGRSMADYVFLSNLAYQSIEATQDELDKWFGPDVAFDRNDIVDEFRRKTDNYTSAVVYKYFEIPKLDNLTIVSIRGTQNSWDMLADCNLWSAAALMQFVRALLPLGAVFTPIMDELVFLIQKLESETIEKVSFYKPTSNFVNYLKNSTKAMQQTLQVTGHSLGGGISIITGAKTGVPAVALSGPNAMISRRTFGITQEALDRNTFNIIPERDIVPMLDDVAQLHQYIRCEADGNDVIGCHSSLRSLCEILFTCGTGTGINKRPVPCECVSLFHYPIPSTDNTDMDFQEECAKQQQPTED